MCARPRRIVEGMLPQSFLVWWKPNIAISKAHIHTLDILKVPMPAVLLQVRGYGEALEATLNREIGFILSSFSFRAWRACERARRSCECARGAECSSWAGLGCGKLSSCSRPLCEAQDVVCTWVLKRNGSKSGPRDAHCVCFT